MISTIELKDKYLDLLIDCLTDNIFKIDDISDAWRKTGGKNYTHAFTMTGLTRMKHTRQVVEAIINDGIEGDLVETGIWCGGQTILMQAILKLYGSDKKVFACDSFEGLPPPDPRYPVDNGDIHHTFDHLKVTREQVMDNFRKFDLFDDNVIFLKGWFEETTTDERIKKIALLRLDGDMYSSTIQVLENLYDKVADGGFIVIDDWTLPGARRAVEDFRKRRGISGDIYGIHSQEEMAAINQPEPFSAFWVKQA